jgi:hypothetical protein
MKQALQYSAWAIGLWLNFLVISAMLRGTYRQYPFVFAYSLALLVSTVMEIVVKIAGTKSLYDMYYWYDEVILDVLVYCVVIAFIDQAARSSTIKVLERHWLVMGAGLIMAVSFMIRQGTLNRRMTLVSRDLNICAVVLDLILWSLLLAARRPDRRLLLLSGGLGLQLTGAIMGESLLQLSRSLYVPGTLLEVASVVLGLYIWWRALRTVPVPQDSPA